MRSRIPQTISSIYIHYPFCKRKCHYCDFPIQAIGTNPDNLSTLPDYSEKYIQHLLREIDYTFQNLNQEKGTDLKSLYIGGGTPSLIPIPHLKLIVDQIKKYYNVEKFTEFSIECDPGTFDLEKIEAFQSLGMNRVSLGVQSTNDSTLKRLGRSHDIKDVWDSIDIFRKVPAFKEFNNISFDLIMGLPHEEAEDFNRSLDTVLDIKPGHLSIYLLTLENNTVFTAKNKYSEGIFPLPKVDTLNKMYCDTSRKLAQKGYNHYEISSFSRGDHRRSVHNYNYWIGDSPFHGFGMGAASFFSDVRFTRPKNLKNYFKFVEALEKDGINSAVLDKGEREDMHSLDWAKSVVMGKTRTCDGLDLNQFGSDRLVKELTWFVEPYIDEGYIEREILEKEGRLVFTRPEGYLFSDEITSSLFLFFEENFPGLKMLKERDSTIGIKN